MQDQPTQVTTEEQARQVLLREQQQAGATDPDLPASGATVETDAGWAFFNVKGYMGTVTPDGQVITEPGMDE